MHALPSRNLHGRASTIALALIAGAFAATSVQAADVTIDFSKLKKDDALYASLRPKIKEAGVINAVARRLP